MLRSTLLLLVLSLVFEATLACSVASAQRRMPTYRNRSPLSPFVGYFRSDTGGVSQYFAFVRPQQQLQQINQLQQQQVMQLQQQVQQQQQFYLQGTGLPGGVAGPAAGASGISLRPTSQFGTLQSPAASYFNYMHYYYRPVQATAPAPIPR